MNILSDKRLLLLGGSTWKDAIKEFAESNNLRIIVAGIDSSAGIFQIADESYKIDTTDSKVMKKFIKDHNIDGVYMGGSEPVISKACEYINELGLPCYCTKEQWNQLQNKILFKQLCEKNYLPTVPRIALDVNHFSESASMISFPVITKPSDGCGSNGFSKCYNAEQLKKGYELAKIASPTGNVIVEKYVPNTAVGVFYTFSNGKMYFSGMEDKYPVKYEQQGSYVGGLYVFESELVSEFRSKFDCKLEKMFNSIGIREGTIWIEVFHDGPNYYFNECGFRCGGSVSIYPVDYFYNINQVAADIYYSLTGKSKIFNHPPLIKPDLVRKKKYCIYPLHINPGTISVINGVEEVSKLLEISNISITKKINDTIDATGSFSQVFALIHFVCDDDIMCKKMIDKIHDTIIVYDKNGNNMINRMIDTISYSF